MISVAHSPDSDDYFLFWAMRKKLIDCDGVEFEFFALDTEKLNLSAAEGKFDVVAVSVAAYKQISSEYLILPHGASVGRNYGPVVVAKRKYTGSELKSLRVGIPGQTTTAALLLRKLLPGAETRVIPITPYSEIFSRLEAGEIDAALLIHEGQTSYEKLGLHLLADLGQVWRTETGLPLPLGINVIKRSLGSTQVERISSILRRSVCYALDHKEELVDELLRLNETRGTDLRTRDELSHYLSRYANNDSLDLDEECRKAIKLLSDAGAEDYAP